MVTGIFRSLQPALAALIAAGLASPASTGLPVQAPALDATAMSSSSVRLRWTDPEAGETGFFVERSTDAATWSAVGKVGGDVVTYTDSSLPPATLHYYRVVAFAGLGTADPSNVAAAVTFPETGAKVCLTRLADSGSARQMAVAHDGAGWAAAWSDAGAGREGEIVFQRLDDLGGGPVGEPVDLTDSDMPSDRPALYWNGRRFGLLWREEMVGEPDPAGLASPIESSLRFALVDSTGKATRHDRRLFSTGDEIFFPDLNREYTLVWNGGGWGLFVNEGLVGDVVYLRFDEEGAPLAEPVALVSTPRSERSVAAAWNGAEYGVAWADETMRAVFFQLFGIDGGVVSPPQPIGALLDQGTSVVWDAAAELWAVAWSEVVDAGLPIESFVIRLQLLDAAGAPLGPAARLSHDFDPEFPGAELPIADFLPDLFAAPGGGYTVFTQSVSYTSFRFEIGRYAADADGARVGSRTFPSGTDGVTPQEVRVAADGGRHLVGHQNLALGSEEVASLLVDAAGAVTAGPTPVTAGHDPGPIDPALVLPVDGGFAALWTDHRLGSRQIFAHVFDSSGATAATRFPISLRTVVGRPGGVGLADTFALAFRDAANSVVFDRYDAAGDSKLGEVEVAGGAAGGGDVGLDFSGVAYGVVWVEGGTVVLQQVAPDGALVGAKHVIAADARSNVPRVQWVGEGWALLWSGTDSALRFAVIDAAGDFLVPPMVVRFGVAGFDHAMAWNGELLGIAWTEAGDIFYTALDAGGATVVSARLVVASPLFDSFTSLHWDQDRFRLVHAWGLGGIREIEIAADGTVFPGARFLSPVGRTNAAGFDGATLGLLVSGLHFQTSECLADVSRPPCPDFELSLQAGAVEVSWTAVDDPESGIWRYDLYRDGQMLAQLFPAATDYTDRGVLFGTAHDYEVRAMNGAFLESAGCATSTVSVPPQEVFADGFESGDTSAWSGL